MHNANTIVRRVDDKQIAGWIAGHISYAVEEGLGCRTAIACESANPRACDRADAARGSVNSAHPVTVALTDEEISSLVTGD